MKKRFTVFAGAVFLLSTASLCFGQNSGTPPKPRTIPTPSNLTAVLEKNIKSLSDGTSISREKRQEAYAKLLEGQRHIWRIKWSRSETTKKRHEPLAKNALQKAVELNPRLAEGYTALAELSLIGPSSNIDEAIMLSRIAIRLDPDNFGAHRYLARLFTIKSNLGRGKINTSEVNSAISEWIAMSRLDKRNAEAWAFLSAFYKATNQKKKRIEALRSWVSSAAPLETEFYSNIMQGAGELTVANASVKLGAALLEVGKSSEALTILTRTVSDYPSNTTAIDLLSQALENADAKSLVPAVTALRQAVFANPDNQSLVQLLAETIAKGGEIDGAVRVLQDAVDKSVSKNKFSASKYQLAIGDIFAESDRTDEAIVAYRKALAIRGITGSQLIPADDKDFAIRVINKMVTALRKANRRDEAEQLLKDSRRLFGDSGMELEKQRIDLLIETGRKREALGATRKARIKNPEDIGFLRREASILTSLDRIDEGAKLIQTLISSKPKNSKSLILHDDFSNYLFLSSLYTMANDERRATQAINAAIRHASNKEDRQIAKLDLAYLQQVFSRFDISEKNLREIIADSPGYPIALNNLGYLLLKQNKNLEEAKKLITEAVRIEPRNSSYLDSLGWAYFKLDQLDKAETHLQKAFRLNPTSVVILEHLGDVYRKRGKLNEAKQVWKKALVFASNLNDTKRIKTKLTR